MREDAVIVDEEGKIRIVELQPLREVVLPGGSMVDITGMEEDYLWLLSPIESAIAATYREDPGLKNKNVIRVLEGLLRDPYGEYGPSLRKSIQEYLQVSLTLNSKCSCDEGMLKSCLRTRAAFGEASQSG